MSKKHQFHCYILGGDNLVIRCGEILLSRGHSILGVISSTPTIKEWASKNHLKYISSFSEMKSILAQTPCDYIFSIINNEMLPEWVLKLPKYFAINYHDGLLPRYAGVHATSWAILNEEKSHGVSWHVMNHQVDAGDILKQARFDIGEDETALSLNLKCYDSAIQTFSELVNELAQDSYQRIPQDLNQRSYYGAYQKPSANGWIQWDQSAEDIDKLCRALYFGSTINRLSSPKFLLANDAFIIGSCQITDTLSLELPGTIVEVTAEEIQITTSTYNIALLKVCSIDGTLFTTQELANKYRLIPGVRLKTLDNIQQQSIVHDDKEYAHCENFWVKQLGSFKSVQFPFLPLVTLKELSSSYAPVKQFSLPEKLVEQLSQQSGDKAALADILLAIWLIYLYRLGNQENLGVGYAPIKSAKNAGLLAKHLPFTIDFTDEMDFLDCLKKVSDHSKFLSSRPDYFKDVYYRYPQLANNPRFFPFSIVLAENICDYSVDEPSAIVVVIGTSKNTCQLFINEAINNPHLLFALSNSHTHLLTMLNAIVSHPKQAIARLDLLSAEERKQILEDWNQTETDFPKDKTVHQLFEAQVEKTPNNIAVVFGDEQLTYAELNQKANQLAHYLHKLGVKPEARVAVYTERNLEMVIAILGIIKAGGVYVPIDPEYPEARVQYILHDSAVKFIVTNSLLDKRIKKIPTVSVHIVSLDSDWYKIHQESSSNLAKLNASENLIYIIYTSGSTGTPKGVLITHRGVVRLVKNTNYLSINEADNIAQIANISFDAATFEIWGALINGATLTLIPNTIVMNPAVLIEVFNRQKISISLLITSLFNRIVQEHICNFPTLRVLLVGGDKLSIDVIKNFFNITRQNKLQIINCYGPTEITTIATFYKISESDITKDSIPIGKPISNTKTYVLDHNYQPLPVGAYGILFTGGFGVARGYINQPEQTKKNFILDSFSVDAASALYNTGDLVRWLPDGNLEYLCRVGSQIKIRGYRVDLFEIETLLATHPFIANASVILYEEQNKSLLIAFFIINKLKTDAIPIETQLKQFLANSLPDYMLPQIFIKIEKMPFTSSGKIDKKALLEIYKDSSQIITDSHLTTTDLEELLINIWQEVLGIKYLSVKENFFALGGDSILAMQIIAKAKHAGILLTLKEIFFYPTIVELAKVAKKEKGKSVIKKEQNTKGAVPLAPIQYWFFEQQFAAKHQWSQVCLLDVNKPIEVKILYQSLQALLIHHQILKSRFLEAKGVWKQKYTQDDLLFFQTIELPNFTDSKKLSLCIEEWQLKIQESFELSKGPLFGALLITVNNQPKKLLLAAHHLIIDGVSWRILLEDLQVLYKKVSTGQEPVLHHKTSSYKDWTTALHDYINSNIAQEEIEFWLQQKQAFTLPKDFQGAANLEGSAQICESSLSIEETVLLFKGLNSEHSFHINEILLAILAKTFEIWTNNNSLLVDIESHGRNDLGSDLDLSRTIGWFTSLYPLHLTWPDHAPLDVIFDRVREQLRAIPHNGIGYGVLRYLGTQKEVKNKLQQQQAEVSFNYWGQFKAQVNNTNLFHFDWLRLVSDKKNTRPYVIDVNCWIADGKFHFSFTYNRTHYKNETIQALLENYFRLLKGFIQLNRKNEKAYAHLKQAAPKKENRINSYPLSSLQKGMLFHALYSPQSEAYSVQLHWRFDQELNTSLFIKAWKILLDKYDIFRTSFTWEAVDEPLQIVHADAELIWRRYDWADTSDNQFTERLQAFLKEDRRAGFDFTRAPVMRLAIINFAKNSYYIVISLPHIIMDGWCIPILLRELSTTYQALCKGEFPDLSKSPSYGLYIQWLQQKNFKETEAFWRQYLLGFHTPTDLMIAKKLSTEVANNLSEYSTAEFFLEQEFTLAIRQFAKQQELTLNTVFQGVWSILLARYSQTDDVLFGITLSTRSPELANSEEMLGIFINTIPMRVKLNRDMTVSACLTHIQRSFIDLSENRYTPLTDIESWSEIPAGVNLFQSVLVFENYPANTANEYIFDSNRVRIEDPSHYPLVFYVTPGEQLSLRFNYDGALISATAIERLLGHLQMLLHEMINYPDKSLAKLSLLTDAEYQKMLLDAYTPAEKTVFQKVPHQVFEQQVEETPDATALIFEEQKLSYRHFNEKANQLAHYLRKQGVGTETIVAICVERSIEMLVGVFGILKAGGAYLPIDPIYPDMRIEFTLIDSKTRFIILQQPLFERLKNIIPKNIQVILIDANWPEIELEPKENPVNITELKNLMYVIYTSGSTGKPKGVMLEQHNVMHLFSGANQYFKFGRQDVWSLFHSFAFDFSVWEIWGPLLYGGTLVIVPFTTARAADDFYRLLIKHKVTILSQTPSAFNQLILVDAVAKENLFLRLIIFDGEILAPKIVDTWFKSHDYRSPKLINMYGITETTVHLTCCEIMPSRLIDGLRYPIGKGLPGVGLYVLDKNLQPLPIGVPGELYVGGHFLGRGYLDQELTSKRFLTLSFDEKAGPRLYKTGDLVRRLENGDVDYLGRLDNQIKFRGFRIELDEISAWLEKYPGITHALAIIHKAESGNEYLIAYATTKDKQTIDMQDLKKYLQKYLPDYMVPDPVMFIDDFPLNSNGKIDKQALPAPDRQFITQNKFVAPRTTEEKILADIWKNVLGLEEVGIHDNFFDLGGHSLLALQMLLQIKQHFSTELPVRAILDASTIAELNLLIKNNSKPPLLSALSSDKPLTSCLVPLQPRGDKTPLFLVHPVGGTVFWYAPLVKYLDQTQPLYGIQDPGIEMNGEIPFYTIEEMASFYITAIKQIQPQGPYLLGGASGGAIISFEMARQLLAMGDAVIFAGLFDGWVPLPDKLNDIEFFEAGMRRQYNSMREKFIAKGIDNAERLLKLQWQRIQMLGKYQVISTEAKLTLFKAQEVIPIYQPYDARLNHWENYSTHPVELHVVPGGHETMFQEPHVETLGQTLNACLTRLNSQIIIKKQEIMV